jgi:hypothetical protein
MHGVEDSSFLPPCWIRPCCRLATVFTLPRYGASPELSNASAELVETACIVYVDRERSSGEEIESQCMLDPQCGMGASVSAFSWLTVGATSSLSLSPFLFFPHWILLGSLCYKPSDVSLHALRPPLKDDDITRPVFTQTA